MDGIKSMEWRFIQDFNFMDLCHKRMENRRFMDVWIHILWIYNFGIDPIQLYIHSIYTFVIKHPKFESWQENEAVGISLKLPQARPVIVLLYGRIQ